MTPEIEELVRGNVERSRALLATADNAMRKAAGEEPATDEDLVVADPVGTGPLTDRMARIMGQVERVEKRGRMDGKGGYDYAKEPDVYDAVREYMAAEHIAVRFRTVEWELKEGGKSQYGNVAWLGHGTFEVAFLAGGEELVFTVPMMAIDYSDKVGQKLTSNATKYAILKAFLIATGKDDNEDHDVRVQAQPARPAVNTKVSKEQTDELAKLKKEAKEAGCDVADIHPPATAKEAARMVRSLQARIKKADEEAKEAAPAEPDQAEAVDDDGPNEADRALEEI